MTDPAKALRGPLSAYDKSPAGTRFPVFFSHVDQARQAHYHQTTDITGAMFANLADVSIFAQDVSRAITKAGLPNDGRVLVSQRLVQTGRIQIGETLSVEGEIGPYGEGPRGRYLTCRVAFRRANRTVPLRMTTEHLLPYDQASTAPKKAAAAAAATAKRDDPSLGMEAVGSLNLDPEKVMAYAEEVGNKIHSDPEFAQSRGYRAPLAQGLMQLTALHGAIVKRAMPWEMDLETRFLRPVFWDSQLTLYSDPDGRVYRCVDGNGKLTAEATLHHLTLEDMEP
jgi:acyl dehydratase